MRAPSTIVPPAVTLLRNQFCVGATSSYHERGVLPLVPAILVLAALGRRSTATVHEWCSVSMVA